MKKLSFCMEEIYERTKSYRHHSGRKRTLGKGKGMPRSYGHVKGCANLENICYDIKDLGVKYLTVYAFSTENWKRSREEVEGLMKLFRSYLKKCIKIARKIICDVKSSEMLLHLHRISRRVSGNWRNIPKILTVFIFRWH